MLEAHIETKHSTKVYNFQGKRVMQLQNAMNKQGKKEREGERHPPADQEKRKKYQKERSEKRTRINIRKEWESNPTTNMEKARGRELKLKNFHKDCNLDLVKKSVLVKLLMSKHKITGIITQRERESGQERDFKWARDGKRESNTTAGTDRGVTYFSHSLTWSSMVMGTELIMATLRA